MNDENLDDTEYASVHFLQSRHQNNAELKDDVTQLVTYFIRITDARRRALMLDTLRNALMVDMAQQKEKEDKRKSLVDSQLQKLEKLDRLPDSSAEDILAGIRGRISGKA